MTLPITTITTAPAITRPSGEASAVAAVRREQQWSRAADATAERLGLATLAYVVVATLVITLAPFRFSAHAVHGLWPVATVFDLVMNVVMFVPLGFLYRVTRPRGARNAWWLAIVLGALLSASIEAAQLFEETRYPSIFDLLTNTAGALVGSVLFGVFAKWLRVGANAVTTLALELPLMGLVYLMVPLLWLVGLSSAGTDRAWLLLLLAGFGGAILGAVHGGYLLPRQHTSLAALLMASGAWFLLASIPGGRHQPAVIVAGTTVSMGAAWLRSIATARGRKEGIQRRFELPTLRLVLPLFSVYLALGSLWPLSAASPTWHAGFALFPAVTGELTERQVFEALEFTAAFTLVGYIIAEFYGRTGDAYNAVIARVLRWSSVLVGLLEIARGWHSEFGASALMALLAVTASVFGGWLYHLQRDHVRALWTRDRGHAGAMLRSQSGGFPSTATSVVSSEPSA